MQKHKKILNQTISSTNTDSQGEKLTKESLEKWCKHGSKITPLHQKHDMKKETIGYLKNCRVVPDSEHPGEWLLKSDVYFTCESIDDALKYFSISYIEMIDDSELDRDFRIYLPYPYYNDSTLLEYLNADKSIAVGRWFKKAADPETIALIGTVITFILAPSWNRVYTEYVSPAIKKLLDKIKPLWNKGLYFDLMQIVIDSNRNEIKIYFIPDRASKDVSLEPKYLEEGIYAVEKYLSNNPNEVAQGIEMIKLHFDIADKKYKIHHVQFLDGTDINIIE